MGMVPMQISYLRGATLGNPGYRDLKAAVRGYYLLIYAITLGCHQLPPPI
jgi:hypothetical protein